MLNNVNTISTEHTFKMAVILNNKLREHYRCAVSLQRFFKEFYGGRVELPEGNGKFDIRRLFLDCYEGSDEEGNPNNMYYVYSVIDKKRDTTSYGTWVSERDIQYANWVWNNMGRKRNLVKAMNLYKR